MQEKRTHTRVPAKAIHETPANGVFITKNDLRNYGAFAGLFFLISTLIFHIYKAIANKATAKA